MFLTQEQADARESSQDNLVTKLARFPGISKARPVGFKFVGPTKQAGDVSVPEALRPMLGAMAKATTNQLAGETFDVSGVTAGNTRNGKISGKPNDDLSAKVETAVAKTRGKANKFVGILLGLAKTRATETDDLKEMSTLELLNAASMAAGVVAKLTPKVQAKAAIIQPIFVRPDEKNVADYPEVTVESDS